MADFGLRPVPVARTRSPRVALAYVSKLTWLTITLISFATNLANSSKDKQMLVFFICGKFWATPCAYGTNSLSASGARLGE